MGHGVRVVHGAKRSGRGWGWGWGGSRGWGRGRGQTGDGTGHPAPGSGQIAPATGPVIGRPIPPAREGGLRERRLSDLLPGEQARVVGIGGGMNLRRRLADVGFIPGVQVEVVRVLAGGRLIEVAVRGTRFGLRWQEARQVRVE